MQIRWQGQAGHGVVTFVPQQNAQDLEVTITPLDGMRLSVPVTARYAQLKSGQKTDLFVNYRCERGAAGLSVHVQGTFGGVHSARSQAFVLQEKDPETRTEVILPMLLKRVEP